MLENLIQLVKEQAGSAIINNPAIPNERNEEAIQSTGNGILQSLQGMLAGGGLTQVLGMLKGGALSNNHPVVQQTTGDVSSRLQQQFGLNNEQAAGIAGSLIPNVLNQMAQKSADPTDKSFDAAGILNQLSGGKTAGMDVQGMMNKLKTGLDGDGDGDLDLQDLQSVLSGGGVAGKLKSLFS